jgi:hypothetical protein
MAAAATFVSTASRNAGRQQVLTWRDLPGRDAVNEPRHEDRAALEVRYRVGERGKCTGDPGAAVDAEHAGLVPAELRHPDLLMP